ncbi:RuvC family protein [Actinomadura montaniterrae]|uniref:Crossover junction endodeoxyribonuclease RuvC n=1 Tax=Actinomadura montaniterrae TaxID=1803903 RepID=A0A6L3VZ75_9ACTN|nr:Holliday junction endonuclease [Actinomadura montaniterrae]KAB2384732.1 crossover junction endodeoxyribonuclease RuvC [Actinomadura montaniterrae]
MNPRVIGLDLSLTATGVACWDGRPLSTIRTVASEGDERLRRIAVTVRADAFDYLTNTGCDLAVIEDLPTHAHSAGITGMVHGAVRCVLMELGVPYALVPPATLKKYATGKGNATKPDMRMALYRRAGIDVRDDNQCDAWWLQAAGLDYLGHPPVELPKDQRKALTKAKWPAILPFAGVGGAA